MRTIFFGYDDGTLTVELRIQRLSNPLHFWDRVAGGWGVGLPAVPILMSYDPNSLEYYVEDEPTERCSWTAIDQASSRSIYFDTYGTGFPTISGPGSSSGYLMSEVVNRVRAKIRDSGGEGLYETPDLLGFLDECNEWIMEQCIQQRASLGYKTAIYTGDGTLSWGLPSDFKAVRSFVGPNNRQLVPTVPEEYDKGILSSMVSDTGYYALEGNSVLFVPDLPNGQQTKLRYYYRPIKLALGDAVPYDGVFMNLMVAWGVTMALNADEFTTTMESSFLSLFMDMAKSYLEGRSWRPHTVHIPKRDYLLRKERSPRGGAFTGRSRRY